MLFGDRPQKFNMLSKTDDMSIKVDKMSRQLDIKSIKLDIYIPSIP